MAKGGLGVVNSGVYVDITSRANELLLPKNQRWIGANREADQLVLVREGVVIENPQGLQEVDISKCMVFSFQPGRILFYDFLSSSGGYYKRVPN
jgi:hypothetical protein